MPTPEKQFNRSLLWPRASFTPKFANGVTPGLRQSQFGSHPEVGILDSGALVVEGHVWKMFLSGSWVDFEKDNIGHLALANLFSRFGPGCSEGGFLFNGHGDTQVPPAWQLKFGREPTAMEVADACYNPLLAAQLGLGGGGSTQAPQPVPPETPPPVPPQVPPPPAAPGGLHPLSPAARRAEELIVMLKLGAVLGRDPRPLLTESIRLLRLARRKLGDTRPIPREDPGGA